MPKVSLISLAIAGLQDEKHVRTKAEFTQHWWTLFPRLESFAERRIAAADAAEILDDLMLLAFDRWSHFSTTEHLANWAFKSLRWRIYDRLVSQRMRRLFEDTPEPTSPAAWSGGAEFDERALHEAILSLPRRQREVTQRALAGETTTSIATAMAISVATVRSLKRFARLALATMLSEKGADK